ncbi:sulfatase [Persicitalea sp.]|uniref:sulfatase family protein n=1 Tax=Persicitalea sp. TaxID=3100273 RepID=UPI003592F80B
MRFTLFCLFALFHFGNFGQNKSQSTRTEATPPNIIFIIGDDISAEDIGCYGNARIRTPNIDRMAKDGIKFTNFYLTASSCSPSRTSILTGRYPHNTGAAELHTALPAHLEYFPELMKKSGYYTAHSGKFHEGPNTRRAYDLMINDRKEVGEGGEEAWVGILQNRPKNQPFFFWFAAFDAHRPWSAVDSFPQPHDPDKNVTIPPTLLDTPDTRTDLASYYNEIGRIDRYLGELQQELERQGIADNTIIIFMADNGRPFSGSKTRVYDTGMRTPFVMKWPNGIGKPGAVSESMVSSIDIAPTLLEAANVGPSKTTQGVSFFDLLKNPKKKFRNYVFSEHNWHDFEAYERAVRTKDFLYIRNERSDLPNQGPLDAINSSSARDLVVARKNGDLTPIQEDIFRSPRPEEEFFDVRRDFIQAKNLIDAPAYATEVEKLRKVLSQWQTETGDTVPDKLTPDWYHRETGKPLVTQEQKLRGEMPGAAKEAARIEAKGPF